MILRIIQNGPKFPVITPIKTLFITHIKAIADQAQSDQGNDGEK